MNAENDPFLGFTKAIYRSHAHPIRSKSSRSRDKATASRISLAPTPFGLSLAVCHPPPSYPYQMSKANICSDGLDWSARERYVRAQQQERGNRL